MKGREQRCGRGQHEGQNAEFYVCAFDIPKNGMMKDTNLEKTGNTMNASRINKINIHPDTLSHGRLAETEKLPRE